MVRLTKIYTKTGDKGKSSLCTGQRFYKSDSYFQAIGDIDELNSHIGMIYAIIEDGRIRDTICHIQNDLFDMGADISTPIIKENGLRIKKTQVTFLEELIDFFNEKLPPLNSFVMPRGSVLVSQVHITRTVCRRAERSVVGLNQQHGVNIEAMIYLNRLSDLLFVFARFVTNIEEDLWKPALYQ